MVRLFKHYIPHAVLLLGLFDVVLLAGAAELGWRLRAGQLGLDIGTFNRHWQLAGFAGIMLTAMISVGVYGADALRSLRYAGARLLVALSLGTIAISFIDWSLRGGHYWRSTLAYAMAASVTFLVANRLIVGGILGAHAFRRRVLVLGAGHRADRLRQLGEKPEVGFVIVGYVGMSDAKPVIDEAINRSAIHNLSASSRISALARWCWLWKSGAIHCHFRTFCGSRPPASTSTIFRALSNAKPDGWTSTRSTRAG